jgi:hypothetical protein
MEEEFMETFPDKQHVRMCRQLDAFASAVCRSTHCQYTLEGAMVAFYPVNSNRRHLVYEKSILQAFQYGFAEDFRAVVERDIETLKLRD